MGVMLFFMVQYKSHEKAKEKCIEVAERRSIFDMKYNVITNSTWLSTQDKDTTIGIYFQSKQISAEPKTLQCIFIKGQYEDFKVATLVSQGDRLSQIESTSSSVLNPFNINAYR